MTDHFQPLSIIIPAYNEENYIERCLCALLAQNYPGEIEILFVDGMSTDLTREIVQDFASKHPELRIRIFENFGKIVPNGMNIALREAKGEIIIRVDGHCVVAPDYVIKCVEHLQEDGVDAVGGPMETIGETRLAKAIAAGMSSLFGVGNSAFRTFSGRSKLVDTVPFPAYTRKIVEEAGLYDEELVRNQDDDYNYRVREVGGRILLADDVHSTYYSRTSLNGLWRQYYQYGFWKVRVLQKHPHQMSLRQFVPLAFVMALLLGVLVSYIYPWGWWAFGGVAGTYLLANLGATLWTASRRDWRTMPFLPIVFAILHLSYGLGFLVGLARFARRWGDRHGEVPEFKRFPA